MKDATIMSTSDDCVYASPLGEPIDYLPTKPTPAKVGSLSFDRWFEVEVNGIRGYVKATPSVKVEYTKPTEDYEVTITITIKGVRK